MLRALQLTALFAATFGLEAKSSLQATVTFDKGCVAHCQEGTYSSAAEVRECIASATAPNGGDCANATVNLMYTPGTGATRCSEETKGKPIEGVALDAALAKLNLIGTPNSVALKGVGITYDNALDSDCKTAKLYGSNEEEVCKATGTELTMDAVVDGKSVVFSPTSSSDVIAVKDSIATLSANFTPSTTCSVGTSKDVSVDLEATYTLTPSPVSVVVVSATPLEKDCNIDSCKNVTDTASVITCINDASKDYRCENIVYKRTYQNVGGASCGSSTPNTIQMNLANIYKDEALLAYDDKETTITEVWFAQQPSSECGTANLVLAESCTDSAGTKSTLTPESGNTGVYTGSQEINATSPLVDLVLSHPEAQTGCVFNAYDIGDRVMVQTVIAVPAQNISPSGSLAQLSVAGLMTAALVGVNAL